MKKPNGLLARCAAGATFMFLASACAPAAPAPTATPVVQVVVVTATPLPGVVVQGVIPEEDLYVALYERTSPSVVHITSRSRAFDLFRGEVPQEGTGSGFVYDAQGHIVTNHHVVAGAEEIEVVFAEGTTARAQVVGEDAYNDLAVLKVEGVPAALLQPLPLAPSRALKVGTRVIAIGNPFGLDRTLTTGVVSALGRIIEREGQDAIGEVIQTDAAINPGNSGGPLLDLRGRVIGVNTSIQSPSGGSVGIGFAVPSDTMARVVPDLIARGRYEHPTLGFDAYELNKPLADFLELSVDKGLLVAQLDAGGPAENAGVRGANRRVRVYGGYLYVGGDVLVAVDGVPTPTRDALTIYLENNRRPGDVVKLSLLREGGAVEIDATLGAL